MNNCQDPGCDAVECVINREMATVASLVEEMRDWSRKHGPLFTQFVVADIPIYSGREYLHSLALEGDENTPPLNTIFSYWVVSRGKEVNSYKLMPSSSTPDGTPLGFGRMPMYERGPALGTMMPLHEGVIQMEHPQMRHRLWLLYAAMVGRPVGVGAKLDDIVSRESPCPEMDDDGQYLWLSATYNHMVATGCPPWMTVEVIYRGLTRLHQALDR